MGPRHVLSFCACTTADLTSELLVSMGPSPLHRFLAYITSCLAQESIDYIGSSPHLCVFFSCKTATLWPDLQDCMGPRPHLLFLHVSMGPRTHLWFSVCKTPCLASELLVSMGPSPHLWFLHSKQRLLESNNKSLWVPDITCRSVQAIQRD